MTYCKDGLLYSVFNLTGFIFYGVLYIIATIKSKSWTEQTCSFSSFLLHKVLCVSECMLHMHLCGVDKFIQRKCVYSV